MIPTVHLSIVSHNQRELVSEMLEDLGRVAGSRDMRVTVLSNLPEPAPVAPAALAGKLEHIVNAEPAGFGGNHNSVFRRCASPYFCVLNPDLRFRADPFPELLDALQDERLALAAPAAEDPAGTLQDNARRLPTPSRLLARRLSPAPRGPDYPLDGPVVHADWVAGFFMLFRSSAFRGIGGFDERYFLYYEDADICCRLRLTGHRIGWVPAVRIVHAARRSSHRDLRHLSWHLSSMARFFASPVYRAARRLGSSEG